MCKDEGVHSLILVGREIHDIILMLYNRFLYNSFIDIIHTP